MSSIFILKGVVVRGKSRGKDLGFPTVNLAIDKSTPSGTYISRTKFNTKVYQSITFIGTAETFDETDFVGETYIINFDQDIYGQYIEVEIIKKLRDNQKFENAEKLIEQMKVDEKATINYFKNEIQT